MKQILQTHTIIRSKRQPKSMKRILTQAKFNLETTNKPTVKKCGRSNCGICINIIEGSELRLEQGQRFTIRTDFTCASENLIYLIICSGCNKTYIGQTRNSLRQRLALHKSQIKNPDLRKIPVSKHIDTCAANRHPKFQTYPLYKFRDNANTSERINQEAHFIRKYKPSLNFLNSEQQI